MTPFDGRILWWHWQGAAVEEASIGELVASVKNNTPNVAGVSVKSSNGRNWQGALDSKAAMAVTGPDALERWAAELGKAGLELHLWCVLHGQDLEAEAARVVEACRVPGVRSLTLDVEAGPRYFGSQPPETARRFAAHLRDALPETHLGLCFFLDDMAAIHFSEWLPHVSSLHPMLYHWDVGKGQAEPEPLIERAFSQLAPYGLPVVPVLQTYPDPESGKPVPEAHITRAAEYAFARGAAGVGYFRLGAAGEEIFWAIRRLGQPG